MLDLLGELDKAKELPTLVSHQARFLSELAQLRAATSAEVIAGGLVAVCAQHLRVAWEGLAAEKSPQLEQLEAYLLSSAHVEPSLAAVLLKCLRPDSKHIENFLLQNRDALPLFELSPQLVAEACSASPELLRVYCLHLERKVAGLREVPPFVARTRAVECSAAIRPLADHNLISGDFPSLHDFLRTWQG